MKKATRELLRQYADRFETAEFLDGDPSWFMHRVEGTLNRETMAFIASSLSYGSRRQFLPKIQLLLDASHGEPWEWVRSGAFAEVVPDDGRCFYRLYTNHTMHAFLQSLRALIADYGSLGDFASHAVGHGDPAQGEALRVLTALADHFRQRGLMGIVPQPVSSLCKRPCMFLRWMVRDHSPVDLGLWADRVDKGSLLIPVDTHVMQTAQRLGLVTTRSASWTTAVGLSHEMARVFPGDPARGDFALYGASALATNTAF